MAAIKRKGVCDNDQHSEVRSELGQTSEIGFCPLCQMPLDILKGQTVNWHFEECFSVNRANQKECSMGISCDSTIVNHYMKETHLKLASRRCRLQESTVENEPVSKMAKTIDEGHLGSATDLSPLSAFDDKVAQNLPQDPSPVVQPTKTFLPGNKWENGAKKNQSKITSFFQNTGTKPKKGAASTPMKPASCSSSLPSFGNVTTSMKSVPGKPFWQRNSAKPQLDVPVKNGGLGLAETADSRPARRCPFYKKLVDVPFAVDAFSYGIIPGITAYFLSHFHADHYMGLTSKFEQPLYCSRVTANLVKLRLRVRDSVIHPLPLDEPRVVRGVEVTLIEANHCPGAVMFLFRYTDGRCVLHTGDFRADPTMEANSALVSLRLDILYLDTTYCKPEYNFPSQQEVLAFIVGLARKHVRWHSSTLFVCGTYTIGKEKVFLALAEALQIRVWANRDKFRIFQCLEDSALQSVLTTDQKRAAIHVLSMQQLNFQYLQDHLDRFNGQYTNLLAIKPTGWEHGSRGNVSSCLEGIKPMTRGSIAIYGIPYSEHSSYGEMRHFVQRTKPARVIPTVNVAGQGARRQMELIESWIKTY